MRISNDTIKGLLVSARDFFHKYEIGDVSFSVPYNGNIGELPVQDYSGIIQVSGKKNGLIYYTAPAALITAVLAKLGHESTEENIFDLIGEMGNVFAGNLRSEFGADFNISVPMAIKGNISKVKCNLDDSPYVLPVEFAGEKSMIVVFFENDVDEE